MYLRKSIFRQPFRFFANQSKKEIMNQLRNDWLVVQKEAIQTHEKTARDMAEEIAFKEMLKKNDPIVIYSMPKRFFYLRYFIVLYVLLVLIFMKKPKKKFWKRFGYSQIIFHYLFKYGNMILLLGYYRRLSRYYVEKIVYDPKSKFFFINKRRMVFPTIKTELVYKGSLLYTEDPDLRNKWVSYINMETLEGYMIGYSKAWKEFNLFCHLIKQNAKSKSWKTIV